METLSFAQLGIFIGGLVVILGVALGIKQLFQREPPLHREFAAREECEKKHEEIDEQMRSFIDREQYNRDREEIRQELSRNASARKANYERLEEQGREISSLQAQVTAQSASLEEMASVTRESSSKTDTLIGEFRLLNQQVQQVVTKLMGHQ